MTLRPSGLPPATRYPRWQHERDDPPRAAPAAPRRGGRREPPALARVGPAAAVGGGAPRPLGARRLARPAGGAAPVAVLAADARHGRRGTGGLPPALAEPAPLGTIGPAAALGEGARREVGE